jgi:hypothetical protein
MRLTEIFPVLNSILAGGVAEIVPFETGDGAARLRSDAGVPASRRYRKILRDQLV